MDQIIMMAMQTCQEYAQKSADHVLNEYESQVYEHLAIFVKTWAQGHALALRKQLPELERDAIKEENEHQVWLQAQDDLETDEDEDQTPPAEAAG